MNALPDAARERLAANGHLDDLKVGAAKMKAAQRRTFQAAMAVKYCDGRARAAEAVFGWSREAVTLGLHESNAAVGFSRNIATERSSPMPRPWWPGLHP